MSVRMSGWRRAMTAGAAVGLAVLGGGNAQVAEAKQVPVEQAAREAQWWLADGYSEASSAAKGGAGVKVCLIDTGVDKNHPDLKDAHFAEGTDASGQGSADGLKPVDIDGKADHGTSMAAWIVGQGHGPDHELGVMGVAPEATLMSVSTRTRDEDLVQAVHYCGDHGAKVISMSLGYHVPAEVAAYALDHDAVIVSAASNDDTRKKSDKKRACPGFGGLQYGMITATGSGKGGIEDPQTCMNSDWDRHKMAGGDYGEAGVAVEAPSGGSPKPDPTYDLLKPLVRATPVEVQEFGDESTYHLGNGGASTATALTAGVVALVRAAHPDLDAANVINRIIKSGRKPASGESLGADSKWGFGIVDPVKAVKGDIPKVDKNPLGDPRTGDQGLWTGPDPGKTTVPASPVSGAHVTGASGSAPQADGKKGASSGSGTLPWVAGGLGLLVVVAAGAFVAMRRSGRRPTP